MFAHIRFDLCTIAQQIVDIPVDIVKIAALVAGDFCKLV